MTRLVRLFACLLVISAFAAPAIAQTETLIPAIVQFTADRVSVSLEAIEAGSQQITLSWHMVNLGLEQPIALEQVQFNEWRSVLAEGETIDPVGSRTVIVQHSLTFAAPTYRLTILGREGQPVEQAYLTLPYESIGDVRPAIETFTVDATSVDPETLRTNAALLAVDWRVTGRLPTSNLQFQQVIAGETLVSSELPRQTLWVQSAGRGIVLPRAPREGETVRLRLAVIDTITGEVYDSAEVALPIDGTDAALITPAPGATDGAPTALPATTEPAALAPTALPPTDLPTDAPTALPPTAIPAVGAPRLVTFAAEPATFTPGEGGIIRWEVADATNLQIQEVFLPQNVPGLLYIQLAPTGSIAVTLPPESTGVVYLLRARSATGQETSAELRVGG